jgi:hypothetical protein
MLSGCKVGRGRVLPWALAAVIGAATVAPVDELYAARSPRKEHKREQSHLARPAPGVPLAEPYVEFDASKMRFGSARWWEQMRREGRLGGETP